MKLFLVVGLQRTGTTLLSSMLGRHSEINMLFESVNHDVLNLIGKKYNGNKLLAYRQIRKSTRASKWGHLINRVVNLDFSINNKHHLLRPYPTSHMSINDYKSKGAIFITIERDKDSSIKSMIKRAGQTYSQAIKEYELGMSIIKELQEEGAYSLRFIDLINDSEKVLKEICLLLGLDYEEKMMEGPQYNFVYPNKKIIKKES